MLPRWVRFAPTFRFCPTCRTALRNDWAWGALLCALGALAPAPRLWAGLAAVVCGLRGWHRARTAAGRGQGVARAAVGLGGALVLLPISASWLATHWQTLQEHRQRQLEEVRRPHEEVQKQKEAQKRAEEEETQK